MLHPLMHNISLMAKTTLKILHQMLQTYNKLLRNKSIDFNTLPKCFFPKAKKQKNRKNVISDSEPVKHLRDKEDGYRG